MKNNTTSFVLFFCSILISSCSNESPCEMDRVCENIFNNQLEVLGENILFNKTLNGNKFRAIFFFEHLTQINSCANFGDVSYYESYLDFRKDYSTWKYWFRNNHCGLTADSLHSIIDDIIKAAPWISDIESKSKIRKNNSTTNN